MSGVQIPGGHSSKISRLALRDGMTASAFERVYTIDDWYDGARSGAVDYLGRPHAYRSLYLDFDDWDADEDRFELTPLSDEVLAWMIERDAIFRRFDAEREAGRVEADDEVMALPKERARYAELESLVDAALAEPAARFIVRGIFEYGPQFGPTRAAVRWRAVEISDPSDAV